MAPGDGGYGHAEVWLDGCAASGGGAAAEVLGERHVAWFVSR